MTAADHATAVQLLRAAAADHLTHLEPTERDELVERITGALDRCAARTQVQFVALLAVSPHLFGPDGELCGYVVSLALLSTVGIDAKTVEAASPYREVQ